jgi:signal transduction histidine kinase
MKLRAFLPTSFSLSASLAVAFAVFLAPVAMLLAMFLQEQQRDIDFAEKEIRGVEMAIEVKKAGLSIDNAVYKTKVSGALSSSLFTTATDLRRAQQAYGIGFETEDTVEQISEAMMDIAAAGSLTNEGAGPLASKVRSLLAQIGDASNLILDPELSSYYLMDVLIIRLPEVSAVISTRAEALELFENSNLVARQRDSADLLGANGTYRFAVRQLKDSTASALRQTTQPGKIAGLQTQFADTMATLDRLDSYLRRSVQNIEGYDPKVAATLEWQSRQRMYEVSIIAAEQLKSLLEARIARLEDARTQSLMGAATLFTAAMAFVVILLRRRVTAPLLSLTQAADRFVSGDLTEVTPLQGRKDEVGALARAFERLRIDAQGRLVAEAERASAVAANKAKSSFLAVMSHELRTPLNAVIGYAEILEEDLKAEGMTQQLDDAGKIRGAGRHLLGVINQVLDLSKIEAGSMETECIEYCPNTLVREVIDTTRQLVEAGGNTLAVSANNLPMAMGDPTKLRQCLFNLVSNAAKFTQNGVISVEAIASDSLLTFKIKDTGIGMTETQMTKIFEPFVQADESTTRKFGGTGLGLAITRKLARLMGGEAEVTSKLGLGSTFSLSVALNAAEQKASETPEQDDATQIAQAA